MPPQKATKAATALANSDLRKPDRRDGTISIGRAAARRCNDEERKWLKN
jgi:hypothetical protein